MKKNIIFIIILLLILITSAIIILTKNKPIKGFTITSIKYFSFGESGGFSMYNGTSYKIEYKDNKYITTILPSKTPDENKIETEISKSEVDKVIDVLNKNNVSKWDGFDKSDNDVLDGNSFSLSLTTQDDKKIEAHGYMKWPENYSKVESELDDIFMDIFIKNGGKQGE
ncbi:MAG: hypothetical protein VZS44_04765 [Bacilli bacterium]|nr:hypothetical protein [Bacilli bacterium]